MAKLFPSFQLVVLVFLASITLTCSLTKDTLLIVDPFWDVLYTPLPLEVHISNDKDSATLPPRDKPKLPLGYDYWVVSPNDFEEEFKKKISSEDLSHYQLIVTTPLLSTFLARLLNEQEEKLPLAILHQKKKNTGINEIVNQALSISYITSNYQTTYDKILQKILILQRKDKKANQSRSVILIQNEDSNPSVLAQLLEDNLSENTWENLEINSRLSISSVKDLVSDFENQNTLFILNANQQNEIFIELLPEESILAILSFIHSDIDFDSDGTSDSKKILTAHENIFLMLKTLRKKRNTLMQESQDLSVPAKYEVYAY